MVKIYIKGVAFFFKKIQQLPLEKPLNTNICCFEQKVAFAK